MIKIIKDNDEKKVTRGAFENYFKPLGYEIIGENKKSEEKVSKKFDMENIIKEEAKDREKPIEATAKDGEKYIKADKRK